MGVEGGQTGDGAGVNVWTDGNGVSQRFQFRRKGDGIAYQNAFQIVVRHTGKCLDVTGFSQNNGAKVVQWQCHGGPNQLWYFHKRAGEGNALWELRAWHSNKCLDAANPSLTAPSQGAYLQQWECLDGQNQAWRIQDSPR